MSAKRDCVTLDKLAVRTYAEVGEAFGMSKQAVQRIERRALHKLRLRFREVLVQEFGELGADDGYLERLRREIRVRDVAKARRMVPGLEAFFEEV